MGTRFSKMEEGNLRKKSVLEVSVEKSVIFALKSVTLDFHGWNFPVLTANSERARKTERFEYPYCCIWVKM